VLNAEAGAIKETSLNPVKFADTDLLSIGYYEFGPSTGDVVVLLHGFPYDANAYSEVWPFLSAAGHRVLVPYLRGFGPTRFHDTNSMRSGEQSALGSDLIAFLGALEVPRAVLVGYDWGGRAACIVAALHPERVRGLVTGGGYNIQRISDALKPASPDVEQRYWYQYYFHGARGRRGLETYRKAFCLHLWRQWSPKWRFDEPTFDHTAQSFENPDFVDIVIHSYRHRFGLAEGDPLNGYMAERLEHLPAISVPTIAVEGDCDGVTPVGTYSGLDHKFVGTFERRIVTNAGHNAPQECPQEFARSVLDAAS
jgi:pimeloyl-ACP methyl ester carboxylesterase